MLNTRTIPTQCVRFYGTAGNNHARAFYAFLHRRGYETVRRRDRVFVATRTPIADLLAAWLAVRRGQTIVDYNICTQENRR